MNCTSLLMLGTEEDQSYGTYLRDSLVSECRRPAVSGVRHITLTHFKHEILSYRYAEVRGEGDRAVPPTSAAIPLCGSAGGRATEQCLQVVRRH